MSDDNKLELMITPETAQEVRALGITVPSCIAIRTAPRAGDDVFLLCAEWQDSCVGGFVDDVKVPCVDCFHSLRRRAHSPSIAKPICIKCLMKRGEEFAK